MNLEKKVSISIELRPAIRPGEHWLRPITKSPREMNLIVSSEHRNYTIQRLQDHPGLITRALTVD